MKYADSHMAMNLLKWHRKRATEKRRNHNAGTTLKVKALLRRLDKEKI